VGWGLPIRKSEIALLLEFLENSWDFENFFPGPGKLLENIFLTSTPGKLLDISINSRCNIYKSGRGDLPYQLET
jgi:hypothetical protein